MSGQGTWWPIKYFSKAYHAITEYLGKRKNRNAVAITKNTNSEFQIREPSQGALVDKWWTLSYAWAMCEKNHLLQLLLNDMKLEGLTASSVSLNVTSSGLCCGTIMDRQLGKMAFLPQVEPIPCFLLSPHMIPETYRSTEIPDLAKMSICMAR